MNMKQAARRVAATVVLALMVLTAVVTAAWASSTQEAPRRIDTENVEKFTEAAEISGDKEHEAKEETKKSVAEEEKPHEGAAAVEEEAGAEGHHPWWMFPGWQSIFAALAVAYYAVAVFVLPKIMAKEEHH